MNGPDPRNPHPLAGVPRVCFIRNTVDHPQIAIGDYSYYDDPQNAEDFARNVLYLYPFTDERLVIGRFCALGTGVKFIMNGANHELHGFSTYPFYIFGGGWEAAMPAPEEFPNEGDTVVGNDVWIGYEALIMPGVKIGDGVIVAARSVVAANVPPYAIVAGNPARVVRRRFSDEVVAALLELRWWDWVIDKVSRNLKAIMGADRGPCRRRSRVMHPGRTCCS